MDGVAPSAAEQVEVGTRGVAVEVEAEAATLGEDALGEAGTPGEAELEADGVAADEAELEEEEAPGGGEV